MPSGTKIDFDAMDILSIPLPAQGEKLLYDAKAKGLVLRLRASGARTWIGVERVASRSIRTTLGDARQLPLEVARHLLAAGPQDRSTPTDDTLFGPDATIAEVFPRFLASGETGRWKPGTIRNMKAAATTHILPHLGERKVRALTPEEVNRWHLDITAKSSAVRMALSTLSGLMLYAEDHGLREPGSNPCRGLRKKQHSKRGKMMSPDAVRRLWRALDGLQDRMPDACDAVRLLFLTGARRSEILSLRWDRIVGARAVLEDSKTGPRTIWLNAPARDLLAARKGVVKGRFVFPAPKSDGPMKVLDYAWALIRRAADLENMRVHDLRHHFGSVGVSNSIDLRLIGQLLGHNDIDSTIGYAHLATDALTRSASKVSRHIERSLRGAGPERPARKRKADASRIDCAKEAAHA